MPSSQGNKPTSSTPWSTSTDNRFTEHEKSMAVMFFGRIQTIYGKGRCKSLFRTSDELRVMRQEWAKTLGQFDAITLERIFGRLKQKLAEGDEAFRFPDVAQILALAVDHKRDPAHRIMKPGLPEPEWRRKQRYECGLLASKTCTAVLSGKACFLEEKPSEK